jgi:hypothetical protein
MRGFALTLCRVFALLACFVCASGYATSAGAQLSSASRSQQDEVSQAAQHEHGPASDPGSRSPGSDFAESDDDDDCSEEPTALVIRVRPEPAAWQTARLQRAFVCDPLISDHSTLEPRPPRAI